MNRRTRRQAQRRGQLAETIAVIWLRLHGYRIRARNVRTRLGEIDLIASRGKWRVFVEVKTRKSGASTYDVSPHQADRLVRAAGLYLAMHPLAIDEETRFDLILLGGWHWPRHIKGAFWAEAEGSRSMF